MGALIFLAVAYHKFPEGMAFALVARSSGMSRGKAFFICVGLELITTVAGGFVGFVALAPGSMKWLGYVLGHVGGGFLFLVIHALLSEVIKHHPRSTLLAASAGFASMVMIGFLAGAH